MRFRTVLDVSLPVIVAERQLATEGSKECNAPRSEARGTRTMGSRMGLRSASEPDPSHPRGSVTHVFPKVKVSVRGLSAQILQTQSSLFADSIVSQRLLLVYQRKRFPSCV